MATLLPELLQVIDPEQTKIFQKPGIRVFILRNDGHLNPITKHPEIDRTKLWNIQGHMFIETETWGIETQQIEIQTHYLGKTKEVNNIQLQIPLTTEQIEISKNIQNLDKITRYLIQTQIAHYTKLALLKIKQPMIPIPTLEHPKRDPQEPKIHFTYQNVLQTLIKYSLKINENQRHILQEEKEGTLANIQYIINIQDNEYQLQRVISEKLFNTFKIQKLNTPISTYHNKPHNIPLNTITTLINEQLKWTNWITRTSYENINNYELSYTIHKSGDIQEIYNYLRKDTPIILAKSIYNQSNQTLIPLLMSFATLPKINERISKKLLNSKTNPAIFKIFYKGGLINQILLKNAWITGELPPFENFKPYG